MKLFASQEPRTLKGLFDLYKQCWEEWIPKQNSPKNPKSSMLWSYFELFLCSWCDRVCSSSFHKMIQIYFKCIWCVLEHSMLTFVLSLDHHGHPLKCKLWSLFYMQGNWDSERLNNLSKIMQVLNDRAGTWT